MEPFVSGTFDGERCRCGKPAVRKVGEEIPNDDPRPRRHNLTAYVCAEHYAELMGPLGADHIGLTTRPTADLGEDGRLLWRARNLLDEAEGWLAINSEVYLGELCAQIAETVAKLDAVLSRSEPPSPPKESR